MAEREEVPIEHDLPEDFRSAVAADTGALAAVYNDLQETPLAAFEATFADSLSALRTAVEGVEEPLVLFTLGLALEDDPTTEDLVVGASLLTGHVPDGTGAVADLVHLAPSADVPDDVLLLPIRPADCPPDSGRAAADLDVETYHEVVAAMAHRRFDLLQTDLERYAGSYLRPLVRGLEAYADA